MDLEPVKDIINEIKKRIKELNETLPPRKPTLPIQTWVADVAHRFFVTCNPASFPEKTQEILNNLEATIEQLNNQLKIVKPDVLPMVCKRGTVIAVAGGPFKADALKCVLRPECRSAKLGKDPWVTHIITDDICAKHILASKEDSKNFS